MVYNSNSIKRFGWNGIPLTSIVGSPFPLLRSNNFVTFLMFRMEIFPEGFLKSWQNMFCCWSSTVPVSPSISCPVRLSRQWQPALNEGTVGPAAEGVIREAALGPCSWSSGSQWGGNASTLEKSHAVEKCQDAMYVLNRSYWLLSEV